MKLKMLVLILANSFIILSNSLEGVEASQGGFSFECQSIPLSGNEYCKFFEPQMVALHAQVLNEISNTPDQKLYLGIIHDSPNEIIDAIAEGANINVWKENKTPLLYAVLLKKSKAVDVLINNGANLNISYQGMYLAQHSVKLGDLKSAVIIIRMGGQFSGDMDAIKRNIMDYAINYVETPPAPYKKGNALELVEELILRGYNIHSSHWRSSVWYSSIRHSGTTEDVLKIFLKYGVNPNQIIDTSDLITKSSWTPLLRAVYHFNFDAIKILLAAGADINQNANPYPRGGEPLSPLSYAIRHTAEGKMVEFLIENGAAF